MTRRDSSVAVLTAPTPQTLRMEPATTRRRGRPRKVESFADWMARTDAEVDNMARKVAKDPPSYAWLHPAQRRIVQMLIEHMRALPEIKADENAYRKQEYIHVNRILMSLFQARYPNWTQLLKNGSHDADSIPNGEGKDLHWMLRIRNCAGRAPAAYPRPPGPKFYH